MLDESTMEEKLYTAFMTSNDKALCLYTESVVAIADLIICSLFVVNLKHLSVAQSVECNSRISNEQ